MYRTSSDRRFYKIKRDIRQAFVRLVMEKEHFADISITEAADLADINRKTFYLHYDGIEDILIEYADDTAADLMRFLYEQPSFSVRSLFDWASSHADENPFFRKLAAQDRVQPFTERCRRTLRSYLENCLQASKGTLSQEDRVRAGYAAAGLTDVLMSWASGQLVMDRDALIACLEAMPGLEGASRPGPATGIPVRSYENDARMENLNTMQNYLSLVREPVSSRNARQILEIQNRRIRDLMEKAWEIPFYRARFQESGTLPEDYQKAEDLFRFPLLTREDLRTWMEAEKKAEPDRFRHWHSQRTAGVTGDPLQILVSPNENAWITANWLRVLTLPGYNPFTGKTMSRSTRKGGRTGDVDSMIQHFGILRRRVMSDPAETSLQAAIQELNAYRPDYLYNYLDILLDLATYAREKGIQVWKPQYFTPSGGQVTPEAAALLTEVFGPGLTDSYGLTETGACVVRLPGKKYYQINSDTHVVNIYAPDLSGPALQGQAVITPLFKTELPIINYVSGDGMESYVKQGLRFIRTIHSRAFS